MWSDLTSALESLRPTKKSQINGPKCPMILHVADNILYFLFWIRVRNLKRNPVETLKYLDSGGPRHERVKQREFLRFTFPLYSQFHVISTEY